MIIWRSSLFGLRYSRARVGTGGVDGDDRNDLAIEPVRATRHGRYSGHGDTGSGITPVGAFALAMCVFGDWLIALLGDWLIVIPSSDKRR